MRLLACALGAGGSAYERVPGALVVERKAISRVSAVTVIRARAGSTFLSFHVATFELYVRRGGVRRRCRGRALRACGSPWLLWVVRMLGSAAAGQSAAVRRLAALMQLEEQQAYFS